MSTVRARWHFAVLPAALATLAVVEMWQLDAPDRMPSCLALIAGSLALAGRARWPISSALSAGLLALAVPWIGPELDQVATVPALWVAASYASGRWVPSLRGAAVVVVLLTATAFTYAAVDERTHGLDDAILVAALTVPPYVFGRVARKLADYNALLRREKELLHRRAIRNERDLVSVALHDVVAHSISAMVVQTNAAADLLDEDPDRAAELLDQAANAGRAAIAETGQLLRILRDTDNELGLMAATASTLQTAGAEHG